MFGKLPAHGDFIARGMMPSERDEIDAWLAESLGEARDRLGADFQDVYDRAPPWRFAEVVDGKGMAGAMAPSVDSVGRRYPIMVMRDGLAPEEIASTAEACEALIFDALSEGWTADRLAEAAGAIAPVAGEAWAHQNGWWTEGGEDFAPAALPGRRPRAILRAVLTMEAPQ